MKKGLLAVFFLFLLTIPAQAAQLYYEETWQPSKIALNTIDINVNATAYTDQIVIQQAVFFDMDESGSFNPGDHGVVPAYCIEPGVSIDITDAAYNYQLADPTTYIIDNLVYAAWLIDNYWVQSYTNTGYEQMTALQLAIWEVILDYDPTVESFYASSGNFFYDAVDTTIGVTVYFNEYLTALAGSTDEYLSLSDLNDTYAVGVLTDKNGKPVQSVLIKSPIPEPGTVFLFSLGLLGIGAMGRMKPSII